MKIALPTRNNKIDEHFGHCEYYTIFTVSVDNAIEKTELLPSPEGCGCKSDIATVLRNMGVTLLLAGNMGEGAVNKIGAAGIQVVRGCTGNVHEVVNAYLQGTVTDSGETCAHHH
ncbi:MAG: NifB/NifX family molybdenum-iron cluster-binding protein [Bacteroidales bacterium]|nr:NifB/NifX family molybdenum-iron cluster-binding protein [Bacteroidales bacterium]